MFVQNLNTFAYKKILQSSQLQYFLKTIFSQNNMILQHLQIRDQNLPILYLDRS